jgi:hypothetical protein
MRVDSEKPGFCQNISSQSEKIVKTRFLGWWVVINTYCANCRGGMWRSSIAFKLGYMWNVTSTNLSRCPLLKVDRTKLN